MYFSRIATLVASAISVLPSVSAIQISTNPSRDELINAAKQTRDNMLTFYNGDKPGGTPGYMLRPDVYYWWMVGGMLGQLINHWALTGDGTYNDLVRSAIVWQSQDNKYLQPHNQSTSEGNDDQAFWAYACMDAAESNFPAPDNSTGISYLGLAQGVWNVQTARWEPEDCNGGLRWQISPLAAGYNYKNMPANAGLFQLSARLARFTGSGNYSDWAEKMWDWTVSQKLVGPFSKDSNQSAMHVFDGIPIPQCSAGVNVVQYTYNAGAMLNGCAYMYDLTKDAKWEQRAQSILQGMIDQTYTVKSSGNNAQSNYPAWGGDILTESASEFQTPQSSDNDQPSFKAYTIRWLTTASQLVPSLQPQIKQILQASVQGAAGQCVGKAPGGQGSFTESGLTTAQPGSGNNWCGRRWYQTNWDGYSGFGEQMSAMSIFQNALTTLNNGVQGSNGNGGAPSGGANGAPLTAGTGGTSQSQPNAGAGGASTDPNDLPGGWIANRPITTADRAGAGIVTVLGLLLPVGMISFMVIGV